MKTTGAVKERLLLLCEEHNTNINALALYSGISPSTLKSIIYGASKNPGNCDDKNNLRRTWYIFE